MKPHIGTSSKPLLNFNAENGKQSATSKFVSLMARCEPSSPVTKKLHGCGLSERLVLLERPLRRPLLTSLPSLSGAIKYTFMLKNTK